MRERMVMVIPHAPGMISAVLPKVSLCLPLPPAQLPRPPRPLIDNSMQATHALTNPRRGTGLVSLQVEEPVERR